MHAATAMLNSVFAEIIDHLSGLESYLGVQDTERTAAVFWNPLRPPAKRDGAMTTMRQCHSRGICGPLGQPKAPMVAGFRVQRMTGAEKKENGLMWDLYFTSTSVPLSFQFSCDQTPNGVTIQSP